jgi:hypothetical protein
MKARIFTTSVLMIVTLATYAQTSRRDERKKIKETKIEESKNKESKQENKSESRKSEQKAEKQSGTNNATENNQERRSRRENPGNSNSQQPTETKSSQNNSSNNASDRRRNENNNDNKPAVNQSNNSNQPSDNRRNENNNTYRPIGNQGNNNNTYQPAENRRNENNNTYRPGEDRRDNQSSRVVVSNSQRNEKREFVQINHSQRRGEVSYPRSYRPSPVELRRTFHPYREPIHSDVFWSIEIRNNFRIFYPEVRYWRYDIGYRLPVVSAFYASDYIGDVARIYGKVNEVYHEYDADEYYLYIGDYYPYQDFTIIIPGHEARNFSRRPEKYFYRVNVAVTGYITEFENKPEMVLRNARQLDVY